MFYFFFHSFLKVSMVWSKVFYCFLNVFHNVAKVSKLIHESRNFQNGVANSISIFIFLFPWYFTCNELVSFGFQDRLLFSFNCLSQIFFKQADLRYAVIVFIVSRYFFTYVASFNALLISRFEIAVQFKINFYFSL